MPRKGITYPSTLKDIPLWRQRELEENLRWFSRYPPSERLAYIDREYEETQRFIERFGLRKRWNRKKRSTS